MSVTEINIYSSQPGVSNATTCAFLVAFGFPAQYVRIDNLGSVDLFFTPSANANASAPSTGGYIITSCTSAGRNSWEYYAPPVSTRQACADMTLGSISLFTTSTASGPQKVTLLAMG